VIKQIGLRTPQTHTIFSEICSAREIPIYLDVQIHGSWKLPMSVKWGKVHVHITC